MYIQIECCFINDFLIYTFAEGICWTRTAERQTSRMRMEYLRSVLRQEVAFFDVQSTSSNTFQVVSSVSSDAHQIQDTIAEKVSSCPPLHSFELNIVPI